jgi:Zn-dependent protease with chaperone function
MTAIFEALAVAAAVLTLAAAGPFATARLLAAIFLRGAPDAGEARARRLVPFRLAAGIVGFAQIQLAWMAGARALAPPLVARQGVGLATAFGLAMAVITFVAGGVARRVEEPPGDRSTAVGAATLRLRIIPWFLGSVLAVQAIDALPVIAEGAAPEVRWGWVAVALGLAALGVAYGGLLASIALRALVPATPAVRALAHDVAAREGVKLAMVLRLPTPGTRFANAAAIPWARAMVVTDAITELLTTEELRAVLAHEAGHLSEPPRVVAGRLGAATMILFALTTGTRLAGVYGGSATVVTWASFAFAGALLLGVRRLARSMEERADARARATVGGEALASALAKLHAHAQMPMVTGARRVHPDLFDRLTALGVDPGPRPPPPSRRSGLAVGLLLGAAILGGGYLLTAALVDSSDEAVNRGVALARASRHAEAAIEYRRALRLDPEDATAHYDLAIALTALGDDLGALDEARVAVRLREDAKSYRLLGHVEQALGRREEAARHLERAASLGAALEAPP